MDSEHYSFPPNTIDDLFKYCKHWIATNDPDNRYQNWTDFYIKVKEGHQKEEKDEEKRVDVDEKRIMDAILEIQKKKKRLKKERNKNKKSASASGGKKKRKSRRHKKKKRNKTIKKYT